LLASQKEHPQQIEIMKGDITSDAAISSIINLIREKQPSGIIINAGDPPAMSFLKTDLIDWDKAYKNILNWKVKLTQ